MAAGLRVDKWLWQARFFKSRSLSAAAVSDGMRVNSQPISKPSFAVKPGDVLTFKKERDIRLIKIIDLGHRRGPASEAQLLYEDLDPPISTPKEDRPQTPRYDKGGRPSKKDRRARDQFHETHLE